MRELLTYVIAGLATGSIYGLAAMGLVLTYQTSGVFNFAHGAVGAVGAYLFYELSYHSLHLPWPVGALISVFGGGPILGLLLAGITGRVSRASLAMKVVAMVGLLLAIQAGATIVYGGPARFFQSYLPTRTFQLGGIYVGTDQIILLAIGVAAAAGLSLFFRLSRLGVAMRGVVDNPELLNLTGTSARRVQRASWVIGASFAVLSGMLLAPQLGLQAALLTLLVIQAFGAAAIGRFASLPMTFLGGLVIGLAAQFARGYLSSDVLAGLPSSVPFIVLFAALVLMPTPRASEDVGARWSATVRSVGPRLRGGGMLAVLGAAALAPLITGTRLSSYTSALIYALLFLSLGFLVRVSGQTSLCHAGFAAVGAAAIVQLTHAGVPWGFALPAAAVLAAGVGVAVAVPAIRLSGLFLALATLAFGLMLRNLLYTSSWMFGQNPQSVSRPNGFVSDRSYYYLCLGVLVIAVLLVVALQRGRVGRLLQASADAPVALETVGTSVRFLRVIAFAVSAGLAGASGGLLAGLYGSIDGLSFDPFLSMSLLAVLALAGPGTVRAAFLASISFAVIPSYITSSHLSNYLTLLFGAAALLVAVNSTSTAGGRLAAAAAQLARTRSRSPVRARAIRARAEAMP